MKNEKPKEFKNIKFYDGQKEVPYSEAEKDKYFNQSYGAAIKIYSFVVDDINNHDGILVLNNSDRDNMIRIENVSPELKQILISKGAWK